jgi:hypothetical protein
MKTLLLLYYFRFDHFFLFTSEDREGHEGRIMKVQDLPAVVIKSVGDDFSVYLPDMNADPKVRTLEDSFIAYDLGKNYEG